MKKGPLKFEIRSLFAIGYCLLASSLQVEANSEESRNILFLGDSLTAGYGVGRAYAYPSLVQQKIDEAGLNWRVIPSGLSGETTAGGLRRVDWVMRQPIDAIVIALGGNDGLRGIKLEDTERNLQAIIDKARERNPDIEIVLAGMQLPPNLGREYTARFRSIYPRLAEKNDAFLIPFLLEDVGGVPELNLPDGIHPNRRGQQRVAETVWETLEPLLRMNDLAPDADETP